MTNQSNLSLVSTITNCPHNETLVIQNCPIKKQMAGFHLRLESSVQFTQIVGWLQSVPMECGYTKGPSVGVPRVPVWVYQGSQCGCTKGPSVGVPIKFKGPQCGCTKGPSVGVPRAPVWVYQGPQCGCTKGPSVGVPRTPVWLYQRPQCGCTKGLSVAIPKAPVWVYQGPQCGCTKEPSVGVPRCVSLPRHLGTPTLESSVRTPTLGPKIGTKDLNIRKHTRISTLMFCGKSTRNNILHS